MPAVVETLAPKYRYFTVDLLTNEILAEIPFGGVTWERAIKGAGAFSGKIPVIKDNESLNLYETTLPGKTGLYVVRNDECVWGGIIWDRTHNVITHELSVSASEFSSYLYHRKIWKTWNHRFGATVSIFPDTTEITRRNRIRNPQGTSSFDGLGNRWFGASPAAGTREYGLSSTPNNMPTGTKTFARKTWTTAATISGMGDSGYQVGGVITAVPGEVWKLGGYMRPSTPGKNMGARVQLRQGSTIVSYLASPVLTTEPDQWILSELEFTIPEGVDGFVPLMDVFSGGSTSGWAVGDYLDVTGITLDYAKSYKGFFDGTTPAIGRKSYSFTGVTGQSDSIENTLVRPGGKVALDFGSDVTVLPGSSVQIEFYDPKDFQYNGFYRVSGDPAPTATVFEIISGQSLVDVSSVEIKNNIAYITTASKHGFNTGDLITLDVDFGLPFVGTFEITSPGGSYTDLFTFPLVHSDITRTVVFGTATRPLPAGVYRSATVTVRTDTYDYIRNLVRAVFTDFVGTDFPNIYIEPGISYGMDITYAGITGGLATITTNEPHNLAVGQAVQIKNLSPLFDGEYEVVQIPAENVFRYERSGEVAPMAISPRKSIVSSVLLSNNTATLRTTSAHNYLPGQIVDVFVGYDYDVLNGTFTIDTVPDTTTFTYTVLSTGSIPLTTFTEATASSNGVSRTVVASEHSSTIATLTVKEAHNFQVGDIIEVQNVNRDVRIIEKSFDAPNQRSTITTAVDHKFVAQTDEFNSGSLAWTNLIENPVLGAAITGWNSYAGDGGAGTLSRISESGQSWAKLTFTTAPTSAGSTIYYYSAGKVPVTPGKQYFGNIDGKLSWTGASTQASLYWYDSSNTQIGVSHGTAVSTSAPVPPNYKPSDMYGGGTRWVSAVAPANAAYARLDYRVASGTLPSVGSSMQVRAGLISQTSNPPFSYGIIAGNTSGGSSTGSGWYIKWDGATNASPSSLYWSSRVDITGVRDVAHFVRKQTVTGDLSKVTLTTEQAHNFAAGDYINFGLVRDTYNLKARSLTNNVATVTTSVNHNIGANPNGFKVENVLDNYNIASKMLSDNKATITTNIPHNLKINDEVTITGVIDTGAVVSKTAERGIAILTLSRPHNFAETEEITVSGVGAPFDGKFTVLSYTDTRVFYEIQSENLILPARASGTITGTNSIFNGEFPIVSVTSNSFTFQRNGEDVPSTAATGVASALSIINGEWPISSMTANTVSFAVTGNNLPNAAIPVADEEGEAQAIASAYSIFAGGAGAISVTRNTVTFPVYGVTQVIAPTDCDYMGDADSEFNGAHLITSVTDDTFRMAGFMSSNVLEESVNNLAVASKRNIYNGRYTITSVDYDARTVSYARSWPLAIPPAAVQSLGDSTVRPVAIISTFGPYPGNANIDFQFSTQKYSGINIEPIAYRGFELMTAGEALDAYSDSVDGFEYRIDCAYDPEENVFTRTFILIPINFPNPPAPGDVSPLSRFGADKLVFEYPGGSITDMTIQESAEESSTRFFAVGENNLGADAGPPMSIASAEDLLAGTNGIEEYRRWPLLDDSEKIDDIDDEAVLYTYAQRYLAENRPPDAKLTISVNGSIAPIVGTYSPGDWCSLIVDDEFVKMRLASDLEPRNDVIVRKIDSFKVNVPDGTTFPETVSLVLVPEWEVDKRGKSSV